jgi:hypothetical protein
VAPFNRGQTFIPCRLSNLFVLSMTASLRRAGKGVRLVIGAGAVKAIDDGLAALIARAVATRNMLLAGRDNSIEAMAPRLGVRRDYVAVLVRLSYLSPEIIRAILVGQQPIELTPTRLVAVSWSRDNLHPAGARTMVLPGVAAFTRVCAYDRPGTIGEVNPGLDPYGPLFFPSRSDPVPQPRTAGQGRRPARAAARR